MSKYHFIFWFGLPILIPSFVSHMICRLICAGAAIVLKYVQVLQMCFNYDLKRYPDPEDLIFKFNCEYCNGIINIWQM